MNSIMPSLGVNFKDYDPNYLLDGYKWRVTEKIDGVRKIFYKSPSGRISCYSRSGKEDPYLGHICEFLQEPRFQNNTFFDCEVVDRELYFNKVDSFNLRSMTIGKVAQEYMDNKLDLIAICFDMATPDGDLTPCSKRTENLIQMFLGSPISEPMILVPIYGVINGYDQEMLSYLMQQIDMINGEGLMLANWDAPYIPGRSKDLVKIKRMEEFVGTVIGYEIADKSSKIAGGIASLICDVEGCTVPVKVGTGFSHELRKELCDDNIIGTKIEIDAFSRTKDKNGDISLSMPVFKQLVHI